MRVATRATKPMAMTGLPAPFDDVVAAEVVAGEDPVITMDVIAEGIEVVVPVAIVIPVAIDIPEVDPPMGAVDWPLISAWIDELKVPVMPAKLIRQDGNKGGMSMQIKKNVKKDYAYVNKAEKASS